MFECVNCRKEKPDDEEGSVNLMAKIGFSAFMLLIARDLRWPSKTCKDCVTQISSVGLIGFVVVIIIFLFGFLYLLSKL
jgi:hypothetical protein